MPKDVPATLIDSSSWVHALRESGDQQVRRRVARLVSAGEAVWCNAIRLELWNGARGSSEKRRLKEFDEELPRVDVDDAVWNLACSLASSARATGLTIPAIDLLIFACARRHQIDLEHCDEHFDQLGKLPLTATEGF
jgi:predicted nucleic acid-binding protein